MFHALPRGFRLEQVMSDNWYYAVGQERQGPLDERDMARLAASGAIDPQTLVWRPGMEGWQSADAALPRHLRPAAWPSGGEAGAPPVPSRPDSPASAFPGENDAWRGQYHPAGFQDSVRTVFQRYATFTGRSLRPEYWWFVLFNLIVGLVLAIIDSSVIRSDVGVLGAIYNLAVLVPSLAVGVRRLHDTGRTGWWLLIGLVPIIGLIVLIVFFAMKGEEQDNQYGPA
jgi:uncharacterized membrane protein YhaH (DUF805 family)